MVEQGGSGVELLAAALERLLTEDPAVLAPTEALARTTALLTAREQLAAARLTAVRDVDVRELYCLEQAGSTRSSLRRQLGGDSVPVLDGEWDLRGHLDPETGALLAAELDRQECIAQAAAAAAARAGTGAEQATGEQPDRTDTDTDTDRARRPRRRRR